MLTVSVLQWTSPVQLHGVGQYGADAYFMFCRGQWQQASKQIMPIEPLALQLWIVAHCQQQRALILQVTPADKDLLKYHNWLVETGGQGTGLQRETADPEQQLQQLSEPHPS